MRLATHPYFIKTHHRNHPNHWFRLLRASNLLRTSGATGRVANNTVTLAATQNPASTYNDQSYVFQTSCEIPTITGASIIPIDIGKLDNAKIVAKCRRPK